MRFLRLLLLTCVPLTTNAQFEKVKSFALNEKIKMVAIDKPGDIYLTTTDNQIHKYDQTGLLLNVYSQDLPPTLFDPRDGARMFGYYRKGNSYSYLTPSFNIILSVQIDTAFALEPWLVCPSGDFNIWIIDASDKSLKKINTKSSLIEVEVNIDTFKISNINFIREYQGFVFMLYNNSSIVIFNGLGKCLRTISAKGINYFNFLGEELYYTEGESLRFFDLFSTETREVKLDSVYTFALVTDEHLILVKDKTVEILKYNQQ